MAIECKTAMSEIQEYIRLSIERTDKVVIRNLQRLGEEAVIYARNRTGEESWYDQTGNLRSSIGYVIARDGSIVRRGGFSQILEGTEGPTEGKQFAKEMAEAYPGKYVLIVVAGMSYASYVEDMENKDVLASSSLFVERELPKVIKRIDEQISKIKTKR